MKTLLFTLILFITLSGFSQDEKPTLYEGTLDGKLNITLFLSPTENACGGLPDYFYNAMYKYKTSDKWIQLSTTTNNKSNFIFVEHQFTGVLLLQKSTNSLHGLWMSNDGKKQLKVKLKEVDMTKSEVENFEDIFEKVNYSNNDC